jgi:hypothetical protein
MCPACIATAAFIATGAASAGGLTAFVLRRPRAKGGADHPPSVVSKERSS